MSLLLLSGLLLTAEPAPPSWEEVSRDEGILVQRRRVPGTSLVEFRGEGVIDASILEVAAVIHDTTRKTEWMTNCQEHRALTIRSLSDMRVYHRIGSAAFFISPRDVVLDASFEMDPAGRSVLIGFHSVEDPSTPESDGAVRMPRLKGKWALARLGPRRTRAVYEVFADPGGSLPQWIVNWASSKIPHKSIAGLRAQASKQGYDKQRRLLELGFDWSAFDLPSNEG